MWSQTFSYREYNPYYLMCVCGLCWRTARQMVEGQVKKTRRLDQLGWTQRCKTKGELGTPTCLNGFKETLWDWEAREGVQQSFQKKGEEIKTDFSWWWGTMGKGKPRKRPGYGDQVPWEDIQEKTTSDEKRSLRDKPDSRGEVLWNAWEKRRNSYSKR